MPPVYQRALISEQLLVIEDSKGDPLDALSTKFKEWFDKETDRPLPLISKEHWVNVAKQVATASRGPVEGNQWQKQFPLHESLLLDAELAIETDPRIGILYAALACEVFVQSFLEQRANDVPGLSVWLDYANRSNNPVPNRDLYSVGLKILGKQSVLDSRLHSKFEDLFNARNDIIHRGSLTRKHLKSYTPKDAIKSANEIIAWVIGQ